MNPEKYCHTFFRYIYINHLSTNMKYFFTLLFVAATFSARAQKEADVLKEAHKLISDKKYESAFKKLNTFDPDDNKPAVALLKSEIVEEYFVTSISHQMFALKDLAPGEDIMDYRGKQGNYTMHSFAPNEVLEALIAKNPEDCRLYAGLGHFYYEAYTHYTGNWLRTDEELFGLIQSNYTKAIEGKCANYEAYEALGFVALSSEKYNEAIPLYLEGIRLNKDYATLYYNVAYAYLYTDDRANALKYGQTAYNLYNDVTYKADAARMVGIAYHEQGDNLNAITWYEKANATDPRNFYTLRPLLKLYVEGASPKADAIRDELFSIDPLDGDMYGILEDVYADEKPFLEAFYTKKLSDYKTNNEVSGTLHFYIGALYAEDNKPKAHEHLLKAKEHFTKIEGVDSGVLDIIEDSLEYTKG